MQRTQSNGRAHTANLARHRKHELREIAECYPIAYCMRDNAPTVPSLAGAKADVTISKPRG